MKNLTVIFVLMICCKLSLFSQKEQTVFGKSSWRISGIWGGPAIGVGQFDKKPVVFRGGFGGVEFGKRLFIGWGGFETDNDVYIDALDNDHLKMDYSGFMLGYTPAAHQTIHPSFMMLAGTGNVRVGERTPDNIFVIQPTIGLELNVFRFFHLSLDGGYRLVGNVNIPEMNGQDLSEPYAEIKMKFGFSW